jgi:hypothetical protein
VGRKHSPKGRVVLKKAEKLNAVQAGLPSGVSPEAFAKKFKEMYAGDWDRIVARYKKHERMTPPGKRHPMPNPERYVMNMVNNFLKSKARPQEVNPDVSRTG